ncbi:MAG: leucine-rich repeat domain-containing protein [Lachnospiraceae bacterium]|nr:leucine-rich repeat domain-containing protein [Lachnospiraceae bacterium]
MCKKEYGELNKNKHGESEVKNAKAATCMEEGIKTYTCSVCQETKPEEIPATITINGITYKVVSIAKNAFKNHKYITKVTIGKNVKTIGANAFSGCKKLKNVTIGKNVTSIGDKALYKCTALTKITIPSKVKKLGKQTFYGCKKLKTITLKTTKLTKKNVGSKAFSGIYKKATIKVPKSKVKAYQQLLKSKGISKTVRVKK